MDPGACVRSGESPTLNAARIASGTGVARPIMKRNLFAELRRRNVFRAGAFYIAAVWAFGQGLSQFSPALGLPDWATRWFLVAAAIAFPFWIAFAWFFEFTPEGIKRERDVEPGESITPHTGRKLDFAIIGVLAIAVVLLVTDRFVLHHGVNEGAAVPIAEHSIAVLPFVNMSSDKEQEYFSDGISEKLLNLLAKIPQLQVTARTSSFSFKGKEVAIPEIARVLHVANVLEGSVRKAGNSVRITAQLIKAGTDTHLWSQTYDLFDNIHNDPRWMAFLRKIGKAPEQLAKIEFKVTLPPVEGSTTNGAATH